MQKVYRKLFIGVMTLLLLVTTFTTTTYAWFKINSESSLEGFDFQVNSGEGFHVSIDGINYYRDLSVDQIINAMILGYDNSKYTLINEKLVYKDTKVELTEDDKNVILNNNLLLLPRTSTDGITLTDLYGAKAQADDGSFIEFGIYFKTTSSRVEDGMNYEIYLAGEEITLDDGKIIPPTSISSEVTNVKLQANMNTINGSKIAGSNVSVYSANAMRMSTQDTSLETPSATIYELPGSDDLGSYATDYNGEDAELNKLYNANNNAMYTYYNNLRTSAQLKKMSYASKPSTVRSLENADKITSVQSGSGAKLITFRFWLEGWDADCFDGLDKSISVKLSFKSHKVY